MVNARYLTKFITIFINRIKACIRMFSIRNISRMFFSWKDNNHLFVLSSFVSLEIFVQWLGLSFIWFHDEKYSRWVDIDAVALPWMVSGQILLVFAWISIFTYRYCKEADYESFKFIQYSICFFYVLHSNFTYLAVGIDNIILGVTIVSSTIVAMVLMNRRIVLQAFTSHLLLIFLLFLVFPMQDLVPTIYTKQPIDPLEQKQYLLFWNIFHLYIGIPRTVISVIICVYLVIGIEERLKDVQHQANYDKLTKVTNRRYIMQYLFDVIFLSASKRELENKNEDLCCAVSVILLDIDFFKSVNDTYGHLSGDMVLIELARRLKKMVDPKLGWEVCRHGGEEFLVVLPHCTHKEAMKFAGKLKKEICTDQYRVVDNMSISVTSSLGVATYEEDEIIAARREYYLTDHKKLSHQSIDSETIQESVSSTKEDTIIEDLINKADNALYDAKRLGRNRIISANQYVDETSSHSSIELNAIETEYILQHTEIERNFNYSVNQEELVEDEPVFVEDDEDDFFAEVELFAQQHSKQTDDQDSLFVNSKKKAVSNDDEELFYDKDEPLFVEQKLFVEEKVFADEKLFMEKDKESPDNEEMILEAYKKILENDDDDDQTNDNNTI